MSKTQKVTTQKSNKIQQVLGIKATKQMKTLLALGTQSTKFLLRLSLRSQIENELNKRARTKNREQTQND